MNKCFITAFVLFIALATNAYAQEHNQTLKAHVHGLSELTLVIEGNQVEIQLTSPAMDLVGFEYEANTKKDVAMVENAASKLQQHDTLFVFSGTSCKHLATSIDTSDLIKSQHHDDMEHDKHDNHKGHDDHEEHESHHSEITANYQYTCEQSALLSSIKVGLFELFPNIHKIHTMWIKQNKQGSDAILANHPVIQF
jgi:hypothetical protein